MGVAVTMCKSRHKPSVLATFLIAVPDKKQIKVEGFVLAYSSRGFSSSWLETNGVGRKQKAVPSWLSPSYSFWVNLVD